MKMIIERAVRISDFCFTSSLGDMMKSSGCECLEETMLDGRYTIATEILDTEVWALVVRFPDLEVVSEKRIEEQISSYRGYRDARIEHLIAYSKQTGYKEQGIVCLGKRSRFERRIGTGRYDPKVDRAPRLVGNRLDLVEKGYQEETGIGMWPANTFLFVSSLP